MDNERNKIHVIDMSGDTPKETTFTMPQLPAWTMAQEIGYEPKTTFWDDFSIADLYGPEAIVDTYRRAFIEWRHNVEYITELVLVLNHKGFWYNSASKLKDDDETLKAISSLYFTLWEQLHDWARDNFEDADAEYYFRVTD